MIESILNHIKKSSLIALTGSVTADVSNLLLIIPNIENTLGQYLILTCAMRERIVP